MNFYVLSKQTKQRQFTSRIWISYDFNFIIDGVGLFYEPLKYLELFWLHRDKQPDNKLPNPIASQQQGEWIHPHVHGDQYDNLHGIEFEIFWVAILELIKRLKQNIEQPTNKSGKSPSNL